jgi:hypothetical protein
LQKSSTSTEEGQKLNGFASAGFICSLVNLILGFITLLFLITRVAGIVSTPVAFFYFVGGLAVLGLLFSIIGFIQIKANKSKYTGLGLSIFGMVFNIFVLLLIAGLFLFV